MTKLQAYENALTLFGKIFSQLRSKESCYLFASIKFDFVFFLFALICGGSGVKHIKPGKRFFPRNFNEWQFGDRLIFFDNNNPNLWDIDKNYFRGDKIIKKNGEGLAVLSYGLDLARAFTLEELKEKEQVGAVIDWKSKKKWRVLFSILFFYFFSQNLVVLSKIYRFLKKNSKTNLSLFDFLRYFIYYAFHSARIRYFLKALSRNKAIGKVIFSDIDNAWGNSFMLWSKFYGFYQIVYSHGSSLYFNQRRYFEPETYYVYTTHHEKAIRDAGFASTVILRSPSWSTKEVDRLIKSEVHNIAFVTGMEKNLEVPFGDKEILLDYLQNLSDFASRENLSLLIKSHKLLDWHKDYDDFAKKFQCVRHIKERWSQQDIGQIDLGILAVTESTLALQLLYVGIPVITCAELVPQIWTKHFSAPYLQFLVNSKKELLELLEKLLKDREFYLKAQEEAFSIFNSFMKKQL